MDDNFVQYLRATLPSDTLRAPQPADLEEPRGAFVGQAGLVATPNTVQDVSTILRAANAARIPVVLLAGGTGLVGGQTLPNGPVPLLMSMERMSAVRATYPEENVLVAEAGAILANVQKAAADVDRLFPLSLASEGSARIGGLLGTNAGGVNVLRYGNARDLCLGLEAVLPTGEIWHGLKRLRKDNTGYDLRNLLIGSEGTLGVITAASLRLFSRPKFTTAAILVVPSPRAALSLLGMARDQIGDGISAFELISGQSLVFLSETMPHVRLPFDTAPKWMVLIDVGVTGDLDPTAALETLFESAAADDLVSDGIIAQSQGQRQAFWTVRESIPEANRLIGAISSHDISLPLGLVHDFIDRATREIQARGPYRLNCFGHLGDGNLHFNVFAPPGQTKSDHMDRKAEIQHLIHQIVTEMDGSISAEHGIGRLKVYDLQKFGDPTRLSAMRAIKTALDPNGIMNPGAVLPFLPGPD